MIAYSLIKSPIPLEQEIGRLFEIHFPSFDIFREKYLIPLTGYPANPNWRNDTHPELESIGMTSYGILKSIKYILYTQDKIGVGEPNQSFKNIYFHFGLILDNFEYLFRSIAHLLDKLEIIRLRPLLKIEKEVMINEFTIWVETEYHKRFNSLLSEGKPIFYYPQFGRDYLSLLTTKEQRKGFGMFKAEIKNYRNFYIHNPGVDVFIHISTGNRFVIKKNKVNLAISWSNLSKKYDKEPDLFIEPKAGVRNDLETLLHYFEKLWGPLLVNLEKVYSHAEFDLLLRGYIRE